MTKERMIGARLSPGIAEKLDVLVDCHMSHGTTATNVIEAAISVLYLLRVSGMAAGHEETQGETIRTGQIQLIPAVLEALTNQAQGSEDPTEQILR